MFTGNVIMFQEGECWTRVASFPVYCLLAHAGVAWGRRGRSIVLMQVINCYFDMKSTVIVLWNKIKKYKGYECEHIQYFILFPKNVMISIPVYLNFIVFCPRILKRHLLFPRNFILATGKSYKPIISNNQKFRQVKYTKTAYVIYY